MKTLSLTLILSICSYSWGHGFSLPEPEPYFNAVSPIFGFDPAYGPLVGLAWFSYPTGDVEEETTSKDLNLIARIGPHGAIHYGQRDSSAMGRWGYRTRVGLDNFYDFTTVGNSNEIDQKLQQLTLSGAIAGQYQLSDAWHVYSGPVAEWQNHETDNTHYSSYLKSGLVFDLRDNVINSQRGVYVEQAISYMHPSLTSDTDSQGAQLSADTRAFFTITDGHILALRALTQASFGDGFESSLGIRGYLANQKSAPHMLTAQTEYRFPIWSFIRGVTFFETANLFNSEQQQTFYSAGFGFRFGLPPDQSMSVRWDNAVNDQGEWLSYVNFNQVF